MRGWPTEVKIAPAALDAAQRRRLWEVSEELVAGRVPVAV
jgi:protochlorophyllide reductase